MSANGIARLIVVTQMKADNANEEALHGADKQRGLIKEMKDLRAQQRAFDDKIRNKEVTAGEEGEIEKMLTDSGLKADDVNFAGDRKLGTEGTQKANQDMADAIKNRFQDAIKDLEAQDKLGNFEIQDLMSTYNQAETLASSVLKKRDDTSNAVIGKV
ncbi:MAG: hypothetical protein IT384_17575 [Deltaproteobacteria bacterium]|nr:hypothetical protein [Deltaproteobacteria bacterium]